MRARAADSLTAHEMPAAPRSCSPSNSPASIISSDASIRSLPANGSPIWTDGRESSAPSSSVALASTDAPPMPSRPVDAPNRTSDEPACAVWDADVINPSAGAIPTHMTLMLGFAECGSAKWISPPTVGTPMQLPYPPIPATTPPSSQRFRSSVRGPNISGSSSATGRAPIEMMSRTMPPTPVAAPWYGSIALGCECDSILKTTATPSPTSTAPASWPGPTRTADPSVGSVRRWILEDL